VRTRWGTGPTLTLVSGLAMMGGRVRVRGRHRLFVGDLGEPVAPPDPQGHCCIKEKGVLAMAQSSKAGSPGPVEKYDKPGVRGLLRGFRVGR
jgi:hypothetical protein